MATSSLYAGFWRRYIAFTFDILLFTLLDVGISFVLKQRPFVETPSTSVTMVLVNFLWPKLLAAALLLGSWIRTNGQTPGKWLMGIRIVKEDGSRMDIGTAFLRASGYLLSNASFNIGYLWMLIDRHKQTWHDRLARTYVVVVDNKKPSVWLYVSGFVIPPIVYAVIIVWALFARGVVDSGNDFRAMYYTFRVAMAPQFMKPDVRSHYDKSEEFMKQARSMDVNDPEYVANVRPVLRQAIEELKLARDLDKNNAFIYNSMGNAFSRLDGDSALENAKESYQTAVRLEPNNARYGYNYGSSLYKLARYEDVVKALESSIRQDDDNPRAYHVLGMAYAQLKNTALAKKNYELAIAEYNQDNAGGKNDTAIAEATRMLSELE